MNNLSKALTFLFLLIVSSLSAQEQGILHVTEEFSIRTLLDHRKSLNFQKDRKLKVWSVQLLLSRDKYLATRKVVEVKKITKNIKLILARFEQIGYK